MRLRQHVVIARLSDEEYRIYVRILHVAIRHGSCPKNKSDVFRHVLKVIDEMLTRDVELPSINNMDV
jgi:hypothetical protein